jgi:NitT/TauT family transport system substrate-binding protein
MCKILTKAVVFILVMTGSYAALGDDARSFAPERIVKVNSLLDWKASMQNAAFYLAKSRGYYKELNLDVSISEGNGAPEATALIGSGTYDIGISNGAATVIGVTKGLPVVVIAQMYQRTPTVIYSFAENSIEKPQDLYGKTIGINYDSINADEYRAFLAATKLDKSKIKEVAVGWGAEPILSGNVDALLDYADNEPVILQVRTGKNVNKLYLADYGVKAYGLNIITNKKYIQANATVIKRFLKATLRAWKELIQRPEQAAKEFGALHPNRDLMADTISARIIGEVCTSEETKKHGLGYQTEKAWADTISTFKSLGLLKVMVPADSIYTNQFLLGN